MTPTTTQEILRLDGIRKTFGGVVALDRVSFDLRSGEVHALLGENGAGKSTLIKVLGGIHAPDEGDILIDGQSAGIRGVADADRHGIRIIHQELALAPNLTVAENIYMGREPTALGLINRRRMERDSTRLLCELELRELNDVCAPVSRLSVAHRQLVEIARALSCRARVLILDEPTSALSAAETTSLFATLNRLRAQGVGVIYISHRMEEIERLADRVTVLRDGHSIGTQDARHLNAKQLVKWMVGRDIAEHYHRPARRPGGVALSVENLRNGRLQGVSFELQYGEILGLAGLVGSGRSELVRAVFGIDTLNGGSVRVDGRRVRLRSPRDALEAGIVLVPEDRKQEGLMMGQSVAFNAGLPWVRDWIHGIFPDYAARDAIVQRAIDRFAIKLAGAEQAVSALSGGNQQKVLVGRWMERRPKVLILDEPTRGVDVGAREEMFRIIGRLVEEGMAVLLISSDLAEVMHLSHRIALFRDGRILRVCDAESCGPEQIMAELTGVQRHEEV